MAKKPDFKRETGAEPLLTAADIRAFARKLEDGHFGVTEAASTLRDAADEIERLVSDVGELIAASAEAPESTGE